MTACMQPVTTAYSDMPEAPLNGYIVHVDSAIGKESFEGFSVIKDVIHCSMYHSPIIGTSFSDFLQPIHYSVDYRLAPPRPERQPRFRTRVILILKYPFYIKQGIDQFYHILNTMVHHVGIHEVVTPMEPAGLALEVLFLQIIDHGLIGRKTVSHKTIYVGVLEDLFFLDLMTSRSLFVKHDHQLLLQ